MLRVGCEDGEEGEREYVRCAERMPDDCQFGLAFVALSGACDCGA